MKRLKPFTNPDIPYYISTFSNLIVFSWNPNCLVDESACVPHRYHGISDTLLHSLSIMYLFVSNLLLKLSGK